MLRGAGDGAVPAVFGAGCFFHRRRRGEIPHHRGVPAGGGVVGPARRQLPDGVGHGLYSGGGYLPSAAESVVRGGHRPVLRGTGAVSGPHPAGLRTHPVGAAGGTGAGGVGAAECFGNGNGPEFAGGAVFREFSGECLPVPDSALRETVCGGDVAVSAVRNQPSLLPGLAGAAQVGMWLFYLPGQVLLVLSGFPKRRENTA